MKYSLQRDKTGILLLKYERERERERKTGCMKKIERKRERKRTIFVKSRAQKRTYR